MVAAAAVVLMAATGPPLTVPVALEKTPAVSAFVVALARNEVLAIFEQSEVAVEWIEGSEREIGVKVVVLFRDSKTFPLKTDRRVLGIALLGPSGRTPTTRVMVVFPDRLERLVSCDCPLPMGRALGRAIAHEIGHSLKHDAAHSEQGLMRASISRPRWLAAHRHDFFLADNDAASIREQLTLQQR